MGNIRPLISICVPIYGAEKYIERCATTLFEQTYDNIEYIFVNDCTKDNSIQILKQIISKHTRLQSLIRIIEHDRNRGLAAARNTAIENCNGDFILHVDSDDYIEINTVELLVKKQQENNADIISFGMYMHKSTKTVIINPPYFSSAKEMAVCLIARKVGINLCGKMIRRSLYKENDIRAEEGVNMGEDYSVTPRLAYYSKKVDIVNKPLYHYDWTNINSYSHNFSLQNARQTWMAFEIIEREFVNKGEQYTKALDIAKIDIITNQIIACCNDKRYIEYFASLKEKLRGINKKLWKTVESKRRVVLYLKNRRLISIYVYIATFVKNILYRA